MGRELISKADKASAYAAWGWHLKHAHELERMTPGAGRMYLRRMTTTLRQLQASESARLQGESARSA